MEVKGKDIGYCCKSVEDNGYIIRVVDKSLLGCGDATELGFMEFHPEGGEVVRSVNRREDKKGTLEKSLRFSWVPSPTTTN